MCPPEHPDEFIVHRLVVIEASRYFTGLEFNPIIATVTGSLYSAQGNSASWRALDVFALRPVHGLLYVVGPRKDHLRSKNERCCANLLFTK